jgi:hypothetical protein
MLPFRKTVAILVVVAVFTFVATVPRPEEAKKEADNVIPQVGCDSLTNRPLTYLANSSYTMSIK